MPHRRTEVERFAAKVALTDNTYTDPLGYRHCRTCRREVDRNRRPSGSRRKAA